MMLCNWCFGRPRTQSGPSVSKPPNQTQSGPSDTQPPPLNLPGEAFTFKELDHATRNFHRSEYLGEGGFGKVYSGYVQRIQRPVAVKKLNLNGIQGSEEFEAELSVLGQADHPNIVKLIGHCVEGTQRLIVYEYLPFGSLDRYLFDVRRPALDWTTRLKIALGAANGLDYLHNTMNPPVIYRDMKPSNILLGLGYRPKLSDFGLAAKGPTVETGYLISPSVRGTEGYRAPEYIETRKVTYKCDVYSFGVVLLEMFTGGIGSSTEDLVKWAQSSLTTGKDLYLKADPRLNDNFPEEPMNRILELARRCVNPDPLNRPTTSSLLSALHEIASHPDNSRSMTRSSHTPDPRRRSF